MRALLLDPLKHEACEGHLNTCNTLFSSNQECLLKTGYTRNKQYTLSSRVMQPLRVSTHLLLIDKARHKGRYEVGHAEQRARRVQEIDVQEGQEREPQVRLLRKKMCAFQGSTNNSKRQEAPKQKQCAIRSARIKLKLSMIVKHWHRMNKHRLASKQLSLTSWT